jgi:hypothetical protein
MAKLRDTPVTADDIKAYLETQDDFDLELHVYQEALRRRLIATHGGSYEDPITKKPRQYDVRASIRRPEGLIEMAIECKALRPSFPLVVSRVPRAIEEGFHQLVYSYAERPSGPSNDWDPVGRFDHSAALILDGRYSIYTVGEHVGKSTTQVGRNEQGQFIGGDSSVYDKWAQAVSSADELVDRAANAYERFAVPVLAALVLPILVVSDGTLWVADYSEQGILERGPLQVDETTMYLGHAYQRPLGASYVVSHLHIYTRRGFDAFLHELGEDRRDVWSNVFNKRGIATALKFL